MSVLIVVCIAAIGRAAHNFQAALTDQPDVAIYLLLPEEQLRKTTLLKEEAGGTERHYLAETVHGPMLVILKKKEEGWYVAFTEQLHRK